ncbi:UNVERIFIED_CONTAM: hypothetical protein K2H54_060248 [Gekko kuhli]
MPQEARGIASSTWLGRKVLPVRLCFMEAFPDTVSYKHCLHTELLLTPIWVELPALVETMNCGQARQPAASLPVTAPDESKADESAVIMYPNAEKGAGASSRKWVHIEKAFIFILLIVAIGLAVALGLCNCGGPSCPNDWIGHKGKCYYVSEKEGNWSSSQSFCSAHGAFLAAIEDEEKVFVSRITHNRPSWIGLYRDLGQPWQWTNGENSLPEVIGEGGNCAYLNDEGKASSSRCSTEHHWICRKSTTV